MLIFNCNKNLIGGFKDLIRSGHCHFRSSFGGLVIIQKEPKYYNQYAIYINGILHSCDYNPKTALRYALNAARRLGIW